MVGNSSQRPGEAASPAAGSHHVDNPSAPGDPRATLLERLTVRRLSWENVVRWNRWLAATGKCASVPAADVAVHRGAVGVGFARWRLQRELWRRDVERLEH